VQTRTTRHPDGTVDIVQTAPAAAERPPEVLEAIYWRELRGATFGLVRFSRDAVRVLGLWPTLLRFGPLTDGARPIIGGIFARGAHGGIRWWAADGSVVVAVERFAPLLRGPLWRCESWFHNVVGRRYLVRAGSRGG
jgi:hypothetical protein